MLGYEIKVYSTGEVIYEGNFATGFVGRREDLLYSVKPTPFSRLETTPSALEDVALEVISMSGYPSILRVHAKDLLFTLDVPNDDIVYVVFMNQD